jgi:cell shape-determining protein MreC
MDAFHTFADWKAQGLQSNVAKLRQCKPDYDQLRAQCEELKERLNKRASERAQREMWKKEVGECIKLLPFLI